METNKFYVIIESQYKDTNRKYIKDTCHDYMAIDIIPILKKFFHEHCERYALRELDVLNDNERLYNILHDEIVYNFASKCEYEFILSPWPSYSDPEKQNIHSMKLDIHDQIMMNFNLIMEVFVNSFIMPI